MRKVLSSAILGLIVGLIGGAAVIVVGLAVYWLSSLGTLAVLAVIAGSLLGSVTFLIDLLTEKKE